MIKYKILKEHETEAADNIIEKSGDTVQFTLRDLYRDRDHGKKLLKEVEANRLVKDSVAKNVENFHPFVKDMSEQDLSTCQIYNEATSFVRQADKKIPEIKQFLEEIGKTIRTVEELSGIEHEDKE